MAVAGIAQELQRQQRAHGGSGWDHLGPWQVGLPEDPVQRQGGKVGHEQEQSAELGTEVPRCQVELGHVGDGSRLRPRSGRAFIIPTARQPGVAREMAER
jgi:hypothetical protein